MNAISSSKSSCRMPSSGFLEEVWDGIVEVFDLVGHPKAPKIYAWAHDTDDPKEPRRCVTVLHIPPVTSPLLAVRAAIVQEFSTCIHKSLPFLARNLNAGQ